MKEILQDFGYKIAEIPISIFLTLKNPTATANCVLGLHTENCQLLN